MAAAAEMFDFGQTALFLPEEMQAVAESVFATAKKANKIFEPCQIILGQVQDCKCIGSSRIMVLSMS